MSLVIDSSGFVDKTAYILMKENEEIVNVGFIDVSGGLRPYKYRWEMVGGVGYYSAMPVDYSLSLKHRLYLRVRLEKWMTGVISGNFRCVVVDAAGNSAISDVATVTLNGVDPVPLPTPPPTPP